MDETSGHIKRAVAFILFWLGVKCWRRDADGIYCIAAFEWQERWMG